MACEILVPPPEIKPGASAVKAQSPNHWTDREFPGLLILMGFSGSFNLASGGFLAAPPLSLHSLIRNCSNLPFGTQGRSAPYKKRGTLKASVPRSPAGSCSVSSSLTLSQVNKPALSGQDPGLSLVALGWLV